MKLFEKFLQEIVRRVVRTAEFNSLVENTFGIVKSSQEIVNSQQTLAKDVNAALIKFDARIAALEVKPQKKLLKTKNGKMVIEEVK
jgi:hypothetical protein